MDPRKLQIEDPAEYTKRQNASPAYASEGQGETRLHVEGLARKTRRQCASPAFGSVRRGENYSGEYSSTARGAGPAYASERQGKSCGGKQGRAKGDYPL